MASRLIRKVISSFIEDYIFINKRKHKTKRQLFYTWIIENRICSQKDKKREKMIRN